MARQLTAATQDEIDYPDGDGQPMAETPIHRQNLTDLIGMLDRQFAADPEFYVSGNMFLYYEEGNRYRCFAPDVFVTRGIPRDRPRRVYKTWEEGKGPDLVIELTSRSSREEDEEDKLHLYRDTLKVPEYFLFDPEQEYLDPPLQGHRLIGGQYVPIEPVDGRLPSEVLGLHFERSGVWLRIFDPAAGRWLPTPRELADQSEETIRRIGEEREQLNAAVRHEADARQKAESALERADAERHRAEAERSREAAENERLRRELEELRRRLGETP